MLKIKNLGVSINGKNIINGINASFKKGNNYAILGKNGSGKSSLSLAIMGNRKYEVSKGDIMLNNKSIVNMTPDERAKKGLFLAFQNIPEIPGIKLFDFLKTVYNTNLEVGVKHATYLSFKKIIDPLLLELGIDRNLLFRNLNVGFSGGEKRKIELLQIKLINPKYIILDEVDSGLDINSINSLGQLLKEIDTDENTIIIISHNFNIMTYININKIYIIEGGKIVKEGNHDLIENIKKNGF